MFVMDVKIHDGRYGIFSVCFLSRIFEWTRSTYRVLE